MKLELVQAYPRSVAQGTCFTALTAHTARRRYTTDQGIDLWPWAVQILEQVAGRGSGLPGVATEDADRARWRTQSGLDGGRGTSPAEDTERARRKTKNGPGGGHRTGLAEDTERARRKTKNGPGGGHRTGPARD